MQKVLFGSPWKSKVNFSSPPARPVNSKCGSYPPVAELPGVNSTLVKRGCLRKQNQTMHRVVVSYSGPDCVVHEPLILACAVMLIEWMMLLQTMSFQRMHTRFYLF
jgi:hypothetical protein